MAGIEPAILAQLDTMQRTQQAANAAAVATAVMAYYRADIEPGNLAESGVTWLGHAVAAIVAGREKSAQLSEAYYTALRRLNYPTGSSAFESPGIPAPNLVQIQRSLTYTGIVSAAQDLAQLPKADRIAPEVEPLTPGDLVTDEDLARAYEQLRITRERRAQREQEILDNSMAKAAAASFRHTANGGRDMTDAIVKKDRVAVGYVRVTRPGCCWFCAMLASRGAVYAGDSFDESDPRFAGPGEHKVHDSCGCSLRAVFSRDPAEWTDANRDYFDLWQETKKKGAKGFREAYEARFL